MAIMRFWGVWVATILYCYPALLAQTNNQKHLTVKAQRGDGVYILLDRFQLRTPCNVNYFYEVNGLRKNQGLKEGKTYFLPVLVYSYNGRSIRSTTGNNNLPWAEKVQLYNEIMHRSGLKTGDYRKDKVLWVPYHQMFCPGEEISLQEPGVSFSRGNSSRGKGPDAPPISNNGNNTRLRGIYDIFGKDYARVPLESTELKGKVYYLVSGHGGADPGAVGKYGRASLCEDEYAYDVCLRLARNLLAYGATVYIITRDKDDGIRDGEILPCDKDETCWVDLDIPTSQSARLIQRSEAVNALYQRNKKNGVAYQRLVVIHVDSNSKREQIDMYFYHKIGDALSKSFAETLRLTLKDKYDFYRKGRGYTGTVSARDLHMLRETDPTAVFIELGNIKNPNDQARLVIEGNRQLVANWLFDGLAKDARQNRR
jgi:N-acetylmuramoyl-L-alanine amidase